MSTLLTCASTDLHADVFAQQHGRVEREFSHLTQGSGNVSWLIDSSGQLLFVKTAGRDLPPPDGAVIPFHDHAGRVRMLRNAIEIARSCDHPALPQLLNVVESADGPMLVYKAVPGELIGVTSKPVPGGSRRLRSDPATSYQRLARLPADDLLPIFDSLIELHAELAHLGWVASDLCDGCLIVDFSDLQVHVIDLDNYRRGATTNTVGRMAGSPLYMAPEEFEIGATIDRRTTVFNLGRLAWHFGTRLSGGPRPVLRPRRPSHRSGASHGRRSRRSLPQRCRVRFGMAGPAAPAPKTVIVAPAPP